MPCVLEGMAIGHPYHARVFSGNFYIEKKRGFVESFESIDSSGSKTFGVTIGPGWQNTGTMNILTIKKPKAKGLKIPDKDIPVLEY